MTVAAIAVAGALGALARYGINTLIAHHRSTDFPVETMLINITGSFALGFLFALFAGKVHVQPALRLALTVGFLGAYTTFSTFSLETYKLIEDGALAFAVLNVLGSVAAGLLAVYLGVAAARAI